VFNFRCFENAVQYAHDHPGHEVIEVIYIDGGDPILHYVNFLPESGEYVETTLGWRAEHLEYYRVRRIHPDDWKHIHAEFDRALTSWTEELPEGAAGQGEQPRGELPALGAGERGQPVAVGYAVVIEDLARGGMRGPKYQILECL
jgi:hypothetical protein